MLRNLGSFLSILIVFRIAVSVYWVNVIKLVDIRNIKMCLSLLAKRNTDAWPMNTVEYHC